MTAQGESSQRPPQVSVVVPALNEARNLPHVLAQMPADIHELILVDGHSVDDTVRVARKLWPGVRVVMQTRTGKGNALACGFAAATGDVIAVIDADGSADPGEIPQFVRALVTGADFAKGTRFARGGGSHDITRVRSLGNRALSNLVNVCYGTHYTDLCYGFNAFWRHITPVLGLDATSPPAGNGPLWGDGFEVETLINVRVAAAGLRVTEVPSFEHPRINGVSNLNALRDGLRVLRTIVYERLTAHAAKDLAASNSSQEPAYRRPINDGNRKIATDRVVIIGAGSHFASGISHYTYLLSCALKGEYDVGALLMRRLVPRRFYPGRQHVGAAVADAVVYPTDVPVYNGVDWYWGPSLTKALRYLDRQRPTVVIFQWWTGAVLHTYLQLARYAARHGARIILEWHEGQDVGEAAMPGARRYVQALMPRLLSLVDAHVVHSSFDLQAIPAAYSLDNSIVRVIPHGPYSHFVASRATWVDTGDDAPFRLLYFGVVRPFKGVEDLVTAFSSLDRDQASQFHLSIVGETWEEWTAPDEAIASSPHSDLIERVDRYVSDEELAAYVARADAIVLPYHRSSQSGPLHIALAAGLPVIVTAVGGLVEVVRDYAGAVLVPPQDPSALREALLKLSARRGERYPNPHSWQQPLDGYRALIAEVHQTQRTRRRSLSSSMSRRTGDARKPRTG
jgi:glycosyltransferase involved in cell wall biosynthesis